jgi:Leucine-rich repeat (LRR) protein
LSYNPLESLPESIGQLAKLRTLNLEANQLVTLPESTVQLDLKTLYLPSKHSISLDILQKLTEKGCDITYDIDS